MSPSIDPLAGDPQPVPVDQLHKEVQADVLFGGIPKRVETFLFFSIQSPKDFCETLSLDTTLDLFKTTGYVANVRQYIKAAKGMNLDRLSMAMANVSFSAAGLKKMQSALPADTLGLTDDWMGHDRAFFGGMEVDAAEQDASLGLKDPMDQWEDEYRGTKIDGLFLIAGSDEGAVRSLTLYVQSTFSSSTSIVKSESGSVRPGKYKGREHFGFNDNISQPTVEGLGPDNEKRDDASVGVLGDKWNIVPQSVMIVQDANGLRRPKWTTHGSFLVFRKLEQDVGKWRSDMIAEADKRKIAVEQLVSKMMGRWFSGCPVMVNSAQDDIQQAVNNQFDFNSIPRANPMDAVCPLGAHIRKMNPHRAQPHVKKGDANKDGRILRRGIAYGPDYDTEPSHSNRGLHFVCYQSYIELGFRLCQRNWANFDDFPGPGGGIDTMTGNLLADQVSNMFIHDDDEGKKGSNFELHGLNPYVKPRGGEYFFTPTVTALRETLSLKA